MATSSSKNALLILVLAGEAIFLLPFVLPRVFRPTLLAVFDISNLELGSYFSAYGLVAIAAYFFGGPIADRFAPHKLMSTALFMTACGGIYLSTIPGTAGLLWLYAGWGLSTILLFWAAMLRATRLAGGAGFQVMCAQKSRDIYQAHLTLKSCQLLTKKTPLVAAFIQIMLTGALGITFGPLATWGVLTVWLAVFVGGLGIYALRGLYFALVDEADIPILLTGTAIGLASVIGYLPDIYMPPLMGQLLDVYPGVLGHRLVFGLGVGFGVLGLGAVWVFRWVKSTRIKKSKCILHV